MKKIPFKEISEEDEFWCGATFRKEGTTLNDPDPGEDFYEYVLFLDGGNQDYMLCAHVDNGRKALLFPTSPFQKA